MLSIKSQEEQAMEANKKFNWVVVIKNKKTILNQLIDCLSYLYILIT
jgi:hypothetical protein